MKLMISFRNGVWPKSESYAVRTGNGCYIYLVAGGREGVGWETVKHVALLALSQPCPNIKMNALR